MKFQNTYINLPSKFFTKAEAFVFNNQKLIALNAELATDLGFDYKKYSNQDLAEIFSGQKKLLGSEFISLVYAAHQFGHFVPVLGDGRAMLIGEVIAKNGKRYDIQLKGQGPTAYSRRGDGFSALGPVLREFMLSEFMHTMKIPTTRALAAVASGEMVYRENVMPGGVFTRVASSHIRIGTFQYFYANNDLENLKILLKYSIDRHYPEILLENNDVMEYPLLFLRKVIRAQVDLVSSWMSIGFIHGVMNTDNMSISGETIDYGPCAFMDYFDFQQVYSFIDKQGRYSFINQRQALGWNLARLADTLLPIVMDSYNCDQDSAALLLEKELALIKEQFESSFMDKMALKLSLGSNTIDGVLKIKLISQFLETIHAKKIDFTLSFRELSQGLLDNDFTGGLRDFFVEWSNLLKSYGIDFKTAAHKMNLVNPAYIPRNHLVEKAIEKAIDNDYSMFILMNEIYKNPFEENSKYHIYSLPPTPDEEVANTFCGT